MPCPPLLLEVLLCLTWAAVLSRRLSRALKLLETATLALVSLAESTLELPKRRPHLLARVLRADGGPDDGDGEGDGEGAAAVVNIRESSVNVNLAGNFFRRLSHGQVKWMIVQGIDGVGSGIVGGDDSPDTSQFYG